MPALYPYTYGETLLKIDNVSLSASADGLRLLEKEEPGSRPILAGVTAEVKKIDRAGYVQGIVKDIQKTYPDAKKISIDIHFEWVTTSVYDDGAELCPNVKLYVER
jgi:hypothetical protein